LVMKLISRSESDTFEIGRKIGAALSGGEKLLLIGDLGAGKTVMARGIAKGAGSNDEVSSPTYVIEKIYRGRIQIRHIDLYRIEKREIYSLDLDALENASDAIMIEWGDKLPISYRKDSIEVKIDFNENENDRLIEIVGDDECKIKF